MSGAPRRVDVGVLRSMADRNDSEARNLQDDRNLLGWKVAAAVVTVVALLALTVTSVVRAPNDVWTIVLPLVAMAVVAMVVGGLVRRRRRRS
jgi:ACR3 family arsenite efflux pump ArsB